MPLDPHGRPLDPEDESELGARSIALRDAYGTAPSDSDDGEAAVRARYRCTVLNISLMCPDAVRTTPTCE